MIERVYIVHHTHTDIGYTHPQGQVAEEQAANLARVLAYCAATEDRPPEARFAWTIETGWTLARFWEWADEGLRETLRRYVRAGRVQITATYAHLTGLVPPELLIRSLEPTLAIAGECGAALDTAMASDVNGVGLFYVHLLAQAGVRYLHTAINLTRGGAPLPHERPGGFWWEGPTGERLFVWNNDHYVTGNLALAFPEAPSLQALRRHLDGLEARGYPYDTVILPLQGAIVDNAGPNPAICDVVEALNRAAGRPLCRLATLGAALRDIAARYGDRLQVHRGAWPDWWDDGVGSSAYETGLVRFAHGDLFAAEKAAALASAHGGPDPFRHGELSRLRESLLHYDEHTWGWWRSVEDPYSLEARALGHRKSLYAEEAALEGRRYRERAVRALAARVVSRPAASPPPEPRSPVAEGSAATVQDTPADEVGDRETLVVFNPLGWPRRDIVRRRVSWYDGLRGEPRAVRVTGPAGQATRSQDQVERYQANLQPLRALWVAFEVEVPALGYAVYRLERTEGPLVAPIEEEGRGIENEYYRVEMDECGVVRSVVDKELGRELVAEGSWGFDELIYERITSPGGRADTLAADPSAGGAFAPGRATTARMTPEPARVRVVRDALGATLISATRMPHFPSIVQEVRLDDGYRRVDFVTRIEKADVAEAEALYVAFPCALRPEAVRCDAPGGAFEPGRDQLPGTATDWYDVLHGVHLVGDGLALTLLCGDAPLVEFGEMKTGKTPSAPLVDNGLVFSYALNNHWFTNFFARQSGPLTLRYRLHSAASAGVEELGRRGREFLAPLAAVALDDRDPRTPAADDAADFSDAAARTGDDAPADPAGVGAPAAGFARVVEGAAALDAVKVARDGAGWIVRLHEIGGRVGVARLRLSWPMQVRVAPCDLLERQRGDWSDLAPEHDLVADLAPFGTASWRLRT